MMSDYVSYDLHGIDAISVKGKHSNGKASNNNNNNNNNNNKNNNNNNNNNND